MSETMSETMKSTKWVVRGEGVAFYFTVEREDFPYGMDGMDQRQLPFGTFTSRVFAQNTADFANALESQLATQAQQLETLTRERDELRGIAHERAGVADRQSVVIARWAQHDVTCASRSNWAMTVDARLRCDCGLTKAIEALSIPEQQDTTEGE